MTPLVSIVMAVYNGSKYLEEQVRSLLAQSYENLEVIIADDCSTDDSVRIAERFAKSDPRVKVHSNPTNIGLVKNFLGSLRHARGELICFSDQDDFWRADKVAVLVRLIFADPRNLLSYHDLEICDDDLVVTHPSFWKSAGIKPRKGVLGELAFLRNIVPGCSMMFRKSVADALIRFPESQPFMHDHLALVLASNFGRIVYTTHSLVKYRQHGNNQIGAFYDSVVNREQIVADLVKKVRGIQAASVGLDGIVLEKLLFFCDCLQQGSLLKRLSFLNHYLFLRNDRFLDKMLGFLECLCPELYRGLKEIRFKKEKRKRVQ